MARSIPEAGRAPARRGQAIAPATSQQCRVRFWKKRRGSWSIGFFVFFLRTVVCCW
jgi:hypothetical protein